MEKNVIKSYKEEMRLVICTNCYLKEGKIILENLLIR